MRRLGHSRTLLPLNLARFEVPVRRSPWLTSRSFRTLSRKALFERSSAHLKLLLSRTRSFHFTGGLGYRSIYGSNLRRFRYWRIPKYEGWFLWYDYEDHVEPTLQKFRYKRPKDPWVVLSDDEIYCPKKINFCDPPVERPEECPREFNSVPSEDPPESVNFKMLNRRIPKLVQSNPQSFHEQFYGPGEGPSVVSPRFHPREDEDVDISLPWRMSFDEDFSFESAGEASRQEYIDMKKRDAEEEEAMRHWGPRRRTLHEQATRRRSPPPPRGRGVEVPPPDFYFV